MTFFQDMRTRAGFRKVLQQSLLASNLVLWGTCIATWIVLTEFMFHIVGKSRVLDDISASRVWNTIRYWVSGGLAEEYMLTSTILLCLGIAAMPMASSVFRLFNNVVVIKAHVKATDKRHVAYAWSSGVIGIVCVLLEAFKFIDIQSEDLLIGMGALNMLVEEIRLIEREHGPAS